MYIYSVLYLCVYPVSSDISHEDETSVERRSILKNLGAAGAGGIAASSGLAAASSSGRADPADVAKRKRQKYKKSKNAKKAVRKHGMSVLKELHERDFIRNPSVATLALNRFFSDIRGMDAEFEEEGYGLTTFANEGDEFLTSLLLISKNTDTHRMALYVQPERQKSYAIVQPDDGDRFMISPSRETVKLQSGSCSDRSYCGATCKCVNSGRQSYSNYVTEECYWDPYVERCYCNQTGSECGGNGCSCSLQYCGGCCSADCGGDGGDGWS
jgi:hypothetical protein